MLIMPPARPRNIDDSRSETSSTITNQKEKSTLPPTSVSGVLKGKRSQTSHNGPGGGGNKSAVAGPPAPSTTTAEETEKDANQPQVCFALPKSIFSRNHLCESGRLTTNSRPTGPQFLHPSCAPTELLIAFQSPPHSIIHTPS